MKVVIAGSRSITDEKLVFAHILSSPFEITEVVSGTAKGIDKLGEKWANEHNIPIKRFPAEWKNLTKEPLKIINGPYGKYNALAGFNRNIDMANYADAAIILIQNNSSGSEHMLKEMEKLEKPIHLLRI